MIAHYSLLTYIQKEESDIYYLKCGGNESRSDDERRDCYKYHIALDRYLATISLPPELDYEPYPNLGPKVNHHFQFNYSAYNEIEHPRWGVIQGVGTMKPISRSLDGLGVVFQVLMPEDSGSNPEAGSIYSFDEVCPGLGLLQPQWNPYPTLTPPSC